MATIVLIHGGWHGAWCWYKVIPLLEQLGYTVHAPDLPSHGIDKTPLREVSLQSYTERVCQVLDACLEPVLLVGHSMGGAIITQAAELRPAKVAKLVYLTAFLLPTGGTVLGEAQTDQHSILLSNAELGVEDIRLTHEGVKPLLYADCPAEDIALARLLLVPQALSTATTPLQTTAQKWGSIPRVYIECTEDTNITPAAQRKMYEQLPCERVVSLPSSHSPFFSMPGHLVEALVNM